MTKIDVENILKSVLNDSATTERQILEYMKTQYLTALDEHREDSNDKGIPIYVPLIAETSKILVQREMAIYKNVANTLQRVIDEIQTSNKIV